MELQMKDIIKTHIAYRCPECTDAIFGFVGKYAIAADMLRLRCECGNFSLDIKSAPDSRVSISVPCILCRQNHTYTISESMLFEKDILTLPCPYSQTDIVFIGEREKINSELERTAAELSAIVAGMEAEDIHELQPQDMNEEEILPEPMLYDTLRSVLKTLEAEGAVSCPCGDGEYDLRFFENRVQAYCKKCGATYTFNATTPSLAEEYVGLDELKLS